MVCWSVIAETLETRGLSKEKAVIEARNIQARYDLFDMTFEEFVRKCMSDPKVKPKSGESKEEACRKLAAWVGSRTDPGKFKGKKPYGSGQLGQKKRG